MPENKIKSVRPVLPLASLLLSSLFCCFCYGQDLATLNWHDQALASCVQQQAQQNQWQQVEQVSELNCNGMAIKDIGDLAGFTTLRILSLYNNDIETADVSPLAQLEELNMANNRLQQIKLAGLSKLHTLYLFKNELTTVDLQGLVALKKLRITQNKLKQLDITPLKALENAYLFDNQLEDLAIKGLDQLKFLDVRQNPMPDELYDYYDQQAGIVISHDGNADDWK